MQYRVDPKTGNKLSLIAFGCMRLPKQAQEIERLIVTAVEQGVNYFDTAYIYNGSEQALGNVLQKHGLRERVFLATKMPAMLCKGPEDFDRFFSIQLERLQTDYIDYYLMHMLTGPHDWYKLQAWGIEQWAKQKKEEGKIKQFGFSFHGNQADFLELVDLYPWDFCMIQYNYIGEHYQAGKEGLKYAAQKEMPVFVMEPLLGGRLAIGLPEEAQQLFRQANPNLSPAAWAFRWLWNQPEVTAVLSGMTDTQQLLENIEQAKNAKADMLTQQELDVFAEVSQVLASANHVPCTGCHYCIPCPRNINIPACFAAYNNSFSMGRRVGIHQYATSTGITSERRSNAGRCVRCGRCEATCPQNIPIMDELEQVCKRLEPWWFRLGVAVARRLVGLKEEEDML